MPSSTNGPVSYTEKITPQWHQDAEAFHLPGAPDSDSLRADYTAAPRMLFERCAAAVGLVRDACETTVEMRAETPGWNWSITTGTAGSGWWLKRYPASGA